MITQARAAVMVAVALTLGVTIGKLDTPSPKKPADWITERQFHDLMLGCSLAPERCRSAVETYFPPPPTPSPTACASDDEDCFNFNCTHGIHRCFDEYDGPRRCAAGYYFSYEDADSWMCGPETTPTPSPLPCRAQP